MATKCGALYQGMTAVYANTDCLLVVMITNIRS